MLGHRIRTRFRGLRRQGNWWILAPLVAALLWPAACNRPHKPPVPGAKTFYRGSAPVPGAEAKDPALQVFDSEHPCLNAGQMARAENVLFDGFPRGDTQRWLSAINRALYEHKADCGDDDFLVLVLSTIQMESGVRADPPLAERNLEALFDRRVEQIAGENPIAAGLISMATLDGELRGKLRQDTTRGRVRTERDLARYLDGDLRPWLRDYVSRTYLVPDSLAAKAEARWLPDPVRTIGPMQVNALKAWRNAKARGEPFDSPDAMRAALLDPNTAMERGIGEGVALLLKSYRLYRDGLDTERAVTFTGADYNAGEFSSRNAAIQAMLARITGRPLALDGDLLSYQANLPVEQPSRTELAVQAALPAMSAVRIRMDLLLEKEEAFSNTPVARGICAAYQSATGQPCPAARLPSGAINPKADLKLGRTYTPENYSRALFARFQRNRVKFDEYTAGL